MPCRFDHKFFPNGRKGGRFSLYEGFDELPGGTDFKPVQIQDFVSRIPQPSADFSYLKRPISGAEVAVHSSVISSTAGGEFVCRVIHSAWYLCMVFTA